MCPGVLTLDYCRLYFCFPEGLAALQGLKESQSHMAKKQYYEIIAGVWLEAYSMRIKMKYRQDLSCAKDAEELGFLAGSEKST